MANNDALCGGLCRLLADHYVIKYQARVLLWQQGNTPNTLDAGSLLRDYERIDNMIEMLGVRIAELGCTFPRGLGEIAQLSSLQHPKNGSSDRANFARLAANHAMIVDDVDLLKTVLPLDQSGSDAALLDVIATFHSSSLKVLSGMAGVSYRQVS
ncbi:MAG: hypothetical protein AAFY31_12385 [Pseudomonadota bacterium]